MSCMQCFRRARVSTETNDLWQDNYIYLAHIQWFDYNATIDSTNYYLLILHCVKNAHRSVLTFSTARF